MLPFRLQMTAASILLVLFACGSPPKTVLGRWELVHATNLLGQRGNPSTMQFKLLISAVHGDSVFGKGYVAFDPGPKDERECGVLKGTRIGQARLSVVIFTV